MGYVGFSCDAFIGNKGGGVIIANTKLLCPIFAEKIGIRRKEKQSST